MKTLFKAAGLAGVCFLLLFGYEIQGRAGAQDQRRGGVNRPQERTNVLTFDLEEFSVLEEQETTRENYYLRSGQPADGVGNKANAKVKAYPQLKSEKPAYGTVTFDRGLFYSRQAGIEYCFVVDESEGTGKGYDRFYFDLNNDFDLSNDTPVKAVKPIDKKQEKSALASLVQNVVDIVRPQNITRPREIMFEALTLTIDSGRGPRSQPVTIKIIPEFTQMGSDYQYVSFIAATARRGKIKLGDKELEVALVRSPFITSRFNSPNTGLFFWGSDYEMNAFLGKMRNIEGKFYSFSASADGSQLMVMPYEGEFGDFEVGKSAGELKDAKFADGSLISRRNIIDLKDCPRDGGKIKVPAGNYHPLMLSVESEKLGTNLYARVMMSQQTEGEGAGAQYNIQITPDKPYAFDFTHELRVEFESPKEADVFKPGDRLSVSAMICVPEMDLMLMGVDDRTEKKNTGIKLPDGTEYIIFASLDPEVKIIDSAGKVVAEGKMPFG